MTSRCWRASFATNCDDGILAKLGPAMREGLAMLKQVTRPKRYSGGILASEVARGPVGKRAYSCFGGYLW